MNYLSHFLLSDSADNDTHLGNFLGDIVSKSIADDLPASIQKGIQLHRFIDQFTDSHPLVLTAKRHLYPSFGKYSSVILDVYFDFLLIDDWHQWQDAPLKDYLEDCYSFIDSQLERLPLQGKNQVTSMKNAKWMHGYLTDEGREKLFERLAKRAKYDKNFDLAVIIYKEKKEVLTPIYNSFFPILIEACQDWIEERAKKNI